MLQICVCTYIRNISHRIVTNPMGSASVDTIIVTWDVANSPNCGAVYYMVMISPDMMNPPMNVTKLTATFTDLINDTNYNITVTPYCRVVAGNNATMTIRTSSPVSTQSNNPTISLTNPSNTPMYHVNVLLYTYDMQLHHTCY